MTQHRISFATAADTLAAIPALLGFTPENSVVVIVLAKDAAGGGHLVAAAMRVDAFGAETAATRLAGAAARQDVDGQPVTAVILAAIADPAHAGAALIGLDAIREAMAGSAIDTLLALHAYSLTAGTIYTDLDRNTDGIVPDPAISEAATAMAVEEGVSSTGRRSDIAARFDQGEPIPESIGLAAATTMGEDFLPVTFDELAAVIHAREIPSADLTARVGLALSTGHTEVRDAFLAMATHGARDAGETFIRIAARLTGTARAHALTLAGLFHYAVGDGATAGIAIETVSRETTPSTPMPSLARLLDTALQGGAPPRLIRDVIAVITPRYVADHIGRVQSYT
ncbi:hypothetical protein CH300_12355 [Rhodococcus sp. 15-1154-1]|nr:DUF4192 domain-containing protein [Rhodococcus sp. 15-1154-1]OZF06008.1 hypothetical protein CH300_12355 [Rhodococcus sp. 15-1154-1]